MEIGWSSRRFWRSTPQELEDAWTGYLAREQRQWRRAAWMVHYILAVHLGSDAPSPDALLGYERDA